MRALEGAKDPKLQRALSLVAGMVADGFNPVIFCRFIPTVGYLADALRKKLGAGVTVTAITGLQSPDEREAAIQASASAPRRVLVCTDCLSEGINLQNLFDAVMHYDLSWNPTRHEQREGRVDRYNQPSPAVRALTFYGADNPIDGLVLDVILRRTRQIQKQLGVLLDVPDADDAAVMEALLEASLFRQRAADDQLALPFARSVPADGAPRWQRDDARRRQSFAIYAQHGLDFDDVKPELDATREALGDREATERLVREAVPALRGLVRDLPDGGVELLPGALPLVLRDAFDDRDALLARFSGATRGAEVLLTRTHPLVDALAAHVVETALDPKLPSVAKRCGVIRTRTVAAQTVVLVLRHRFHIVTADAARGGATRDLLAEELSAAGFTGNPDAPNWVDDPAALDALLGATPDANLPEALALPRLQRVVGGLDQLRPALDARARLRAAALLAAHQRVRSVTGGGPKTRDVVPLSTDVLAVS
nr:SWF/SNF helicase family protein [Deltaproteobacteria bacterium]